MGVKDKSQWFWSIATELINVAQGVDPKYIQGWEGGGGVSEPFEKGPGYASFLPRKCPLYWLHDQQNLKKFITIIMVNMVITMVKVNIMNTIVNLLLLQHPVPTGIVELKSPSQLVLPEQLILQCQQYQSWLSTEQVRVMIDLAALFGSNIHHEVQ